MASRLGDRGGAVAAMGGTSAAMGAGIGALIRKDVWMPVWLLPYPFGSEEGDGREWRWAGEGARSGHLTEPKRGRIVGAWRRR